jgi:DNA invertase Pin-like site-specific DNA recombinase
MVLRRRNRSETRAKSLIRGVAYVRCSTSKQDLSPSTQMAAIERFAAEEGIEIVAVFPDIGVSGGAEIADRPGLSAALAHVERGTVLVVAKRDRLARDVFIARSVERILAKSAGRVLSAEGCNGEDEALLRGVNDLMSEEEKRRIRARTRAALAVKQARNERTGSLPYGSRLAADGEHRIARALGRRVCGPECTGCLHLADDDAEQAVILRAKALSDEGLTVRAIAARLNEEGCRNRAGQPFAFQSVYTFLRPLLEG